MRIMRHVLASIALPSLPLVLLIVQLFQTPATILAQNSTFISLYDCPAKYANYTSGSLFESNLKSLLFPTLISNGSPDSFFNTTSGDFPDTVYGLVQCRPDVSTKDCQSCLYISTVMIIQKCPNKVDATIRLGNCMLRYSNIRFFSTMNTSDLRYTDWYWDNDTPLTDLAVFNNQMGVLMNNLTSIASSQPSKFMTGSIRYNDFSRIYGLVDCTQDLSSADCLFCLQAMLKKIPGCCNGKKGAWVLSRSCEIWYRDFQFFGSLSPPPAPPVLPPPPPPSPPPPTPTITITTTTAPAPAPPSTNNVTVHNNDGKSEGSPSFPNTAVIVGPALVGVAVLFFNMQ